jgi:small conductance mechanosensitive channel
MDIEKLITQGTEMFVSYAPQVVLALITLLVGFWIINRVVKLTRTALANRQMDEALQTFLGDLISVVLKVVLLISVAGMVGIETTSFAVVMGAAGLAIGMALQGSLGNFAGGVMIMLFRPFKIGDLIDAQGYFGHVTAINIFVTTLLSPENKTVILPNGPLSNGSVVNLSRVGNLRVDLVVGISYGADIRKAREVILAVMQNDPKVLKDPAPSVNVLELADSSVNLAVRPYATPADYWDVYFGTLEKAKMALDANGIEIPFPQRVIHQAKA